MVSCADVTFASCLRGADTLSQFDTNGATGGCQAIYTMYPSQTSSQPSCSNLTLPTNTLGVDGFVDNGPISQYGWIDQVRDLDPRPPYSPLMCVSVYRRLAGPQKWDTTIHYACCPGSPSSIQDRVA